MPAHALLMACRRLSPLLTLCDNQYTQIHTLLFGNDDKGKSPSVFSAGASFRSLLKLQLVESAHVDRRGGGHRPWANRVCLRSLLRVWRQISRCCGLSVPRHITTELTCGARKWLRGPGSQSGRSRSPWLHAVPGRAARAPGGAQDAQIRALPCSGRLRSAPLWGLLHPRAGRRGLHGTRLCPASARGSSSPGLLPPLSLSGL